MSITNVSSARWSLMVQFALFGLVMSAWTSRMPSVQASLGIGALQLGSLLIVGGIGALIGALVVGAVIARFGSRTTLLAGTIINAVGFGLDAIGLANADLTAFIAGLFVNGLCGALINVPININAAAVEQHVGRAVLPHFHAAFSIGAAGGALVGAGFAFAEVHIATQIVIVTVIVTAVRLWLLRASTALTAHRPVDTATGSVAAVTGSVSAVTGSVSAVTGSVSAVTGSVAAQSTGDRTGGAVRSALAAWREPRTLLLGVVLLAASLAEGSATTWLSLAVVDGFAAAEAVGAVAFGTFVGAMTVFRFLGTRLIDRFGRVVVLRASGASSLLGLALFGLGPNLTVAWIGIVLWGFGAALANPIAIAAASDDPGKAGQRVSVVTSFSTIASLGAPPLLGMLADAVGARHALLVIGAAVIVSFAVAGQVRRQPPERAGASGAESARDHSLRTGAAISGVQHDTSGPDGNERGA
ncbi:MFS transporter [Agromyces badenianii]|uniref:MFS transporter n=1 Tax=Agromyces badenianii TaxID=2080742 RepID=UPI000D59E606|nr:MFS transporter [Agromyces badenianii]PWC05195.1 MFS transporter [Agromyces badenianii]